MATAAIVLATFMQFRLPVCGTQIFESARARTSLDMPRASLPNTKASWIPKVPLNRSAASGEGSRATSFLPVWRIQSAASPGIVKYLHSTMFCVPLAV